MAKSRMFFIFTVFTIALMGCAHVEEGTFVQGEIAEVNKENGSMEIEINTWVTVGGAEEFSFEEIPDTQRVHVSDPKKYEEGQTVEVKVDKKDKEDVWDLDQLEFEVEKVK